MARRAQKGHRYLILGMTAAVLLIAGAVVYVAVPRPPKWREVAANAPVLGPYVLHGNVIIDGKGRPFFLHGVDRPSLEWDCDGQSLTGHQGIPASDFATIAGWGANAVRLSLNQDYWLSAKGHQVDTAENCPNYVSTVRSAVDEIEAHGMAVILDLHVSDPGNPMLPAGMEDMPDASSVLFWQSVAATFGSNWNVFFELFNEPHGVSWSVWQNGGRVTSGGVTYQAVGMQQLVDAVRGVGVHNLVIVDGPDFGATLQRLPSHLLTGGGIVYAVHPYAGVDGSDPAIWQQRFGFLTADRVVVATEFGDQEPGDTRYDQDILSFFRTHGMGWTAWAWWNGGYRFPSLVGGAAGDCVDAGCPDESALRAFAGGHVPMLVPTS
jgi:endoglucanase